MNGHRYTEEQIAFIREFLPGRSHKELTRLFNARFGLALTCQQVTAAAKNRKINNGLNGCFPPGHIPANKGQKGIRRSPATEFKPGNRPQTYRPVGSERITTDGYWEVKIADPKTWRGKHILVWEALHGPRPKGHVIVFGDGNKLNVAPENLVLVSRAELARMNQMGLVGGSAELTQVGQNLAKLTMRIASAQKSARKRKKEQRGFYTAPTGLL